ncbi:MAG: hypothetical protein DMG14_27985 [Acidobacteria bacterium]|nr:MAG: hypothetical protein DMG14_27985 [Acidobacteriota bacterium]
MINENWGLRIGQISKSAILDTKLRCRMSLLPSKKYSIHTRIPCLEANMKPNSVLIRITEESMLKRVLATFVVAACIGAALHINLVAQQRGQQPTNLTEKQWLESKEAQAHVTAAMAIAKPDLLEEAANLCSARGPQRPAVLRQEAGLPPVPRQTLEPTKIFDNLYYVGFNDAGAWALTTSQRIIVIDSLNTPEEAEKILIPGMEKAGLDPKQIKYVVIVHGHFDL